MKEEKILVGNKDWMKNFKLFFLIIVILFSITILSCSIHSDERPNIILILADDLGYGDLGCYGQTNFSTPNIDKLAEEGMRFTQHYSGSTVCAPSRCVLMTGKHTGHSFTRGNAGDPNGFGQLPLPTSEETFVKYLQATGYKTGAFGKWGLGNAETSGDPLKHGFDTFFGYHDQVLAHNSYPEYLIRNSEKIFLSNEVQYLSDTLWHKGLGSYSTEKVEYSNDLIFDEMINFIDENSDIKFFVYFPTTIPHDNGEAEVGKRFEVPDDSKFQQMDWLQEEKAYAALVEHLDMYIGKLTAKLKQLNLEKNTIVIFTSDNGPLKSLNLESNGILRGYKRDLYEGGIRVPMIVKWPDKLKAGSTSEQISAFWDFFPTLCEIAEVENFPKSDGISFLPTLFGKKQKEHDNLYWEFHWWNATKFAVRKGNWKAVRNSPEGNIELYDLSKDPTELNNIASQNPLIVSEMKRIIKESRTDSEHFKLIL